MLKREIMDNIYGLWSKHYSATLKIEEERERLMRTRDRTIKPGEMSPPPYMKRKKSKPMKEIARMVLAYMREQPVGALITPTQIGETIGINPKLVGNSIRQLLWRTSEVAFKMDSDGNKKHYYYTGAEREDV